MCSARKMTSLLKTFLTSCVNLAGIQLNPAVSLAEYYHAIHALSICKHEKFLNFGKYFVYKDTILPKLFFQFS